MILALGELALAWNFAGATLTTWYPSPTFLIYAQPNAVWAVSFLAIGASKLIFLNVYRRLRLVRLCMAVEVAFMMYLAWGTTQPYFTGKGSLQLPILYGVLALLQVPLLLEPFINPLTARWKKR